MKALHIAYSEYQSDPRVRRQTEALVDAGWDVTALGIAPLEAPAIADLNGVEVHSLRMERYRGSAMRQYLTGYRRFVQWAAARCWAGREEFDYVQVHTPPDWAVFSATAFRLRGTPVVLDVHDLTPELFEDRFRGGKRWATGALELAERGSAGTSTHVLTVSETFRKRLVGRGVPPDKVTIIMNLPDPKVFWRDRPADLPDHPVLSYHGTLVPRYGTDLVLEAAALLAPTHPDLEVLIIGDGDQKPELEARASEPDLSGRVRFSAGRVPTDEIPAALGAVTAGIVANRPDGFANLVLSTKFMEYLALAVPAVITKTEGLVDHFDPSTLFTVESATPRALARVAAEIISDPVAAAEKTAEARRFFEVHNWESESATYVGLVTRLAATA